MPDKKRRRRQRGEGAVFQRADGMWIGQLDLGWIDGKRRRPTVSSKTQRGALKKLTELKDTVKQSGGRTPDRRMTAEKWLTYWLEQIVAPNAKPKTFVFYRNMVNVHLIPALGTHRLTALTTEHVRAMHTAVTSKTWRGKRLSATTAAHAHQTLHTALEAARKEGKITANVAELVDPPTRRKSDRGSLTAAEARTLLQKTADDRLSAAWMTALLSGARRGEVLALQWDRVDLDRWTVDLSWQLQEVTFRHGCGDEPCGRKRAGSCPQRELDVPYDFEYRQLDGRLCMLRPKSEASTRLVPIVAPLHAALTKRSEEYEAERGDYREDHGLVWPRPDGRPIVPGAATAAWKDACAAAGVPVVDLHVARHTTATILLEAGVDAKVIQQIVGHSTVVMTRGYQHVDLELARRALDTLADTIKLELPSG